jgi:hypothetical protein
LHCRHVCKTCAFHDALQAGNTKDVRRRQLAFAYSFQKLYERCQKSVVKDGDYFEGQ